MDDRNYDLFVMVTAGIDWKDTQRVEPRAEKKGETKILHDSVHRDPGRARPARTKRNMKMKEPK